MRNLIALVCVVGALSLAQSFAAEATKANPWQQALASVPAAEMPARAAELVKAASRHDRARATAGVVRAALAMNSGTTAVVVGAIAEAVPDMAAVAAGTAASEQPVQAADIARAATVAAPSKVESIVAAVCRAAPQEYRKIASRVAQVAPGSTKEILRAVASVFPDMRPGIEKAVAGSGYGSLSVGAVLDSAQPAGGSGSVASSQGSASLTTASPTVPDDFARGPTIAPPYVPLPAGTTNVIPSTSGTVPRGERNYAAP